jgi:hypothetical protein
MHLDKSKHAVHIHTNTYGIVLLLLLLFKMFIKLLQYYLMTQSQWVH